MVEEVHEKMTLDENNYLKMVKERFQRKSSFKANESKSILSSVKKFLPFGSKKDIEKPALYEDKFEEVKYQGNFKNDLEIFFRNLKLEDVPKIMRDVVSLKKYFEVEYKSSDYGFNEVFSQEEIDEHFIGIMYQSKENQCFYEKLLCDKDLFREKIEYEKNFALILSLNKCVKRYKEDLKESAFIELLDLNLFLQKSDFDFNFDLMNLYDNRSELKELDKKIYDQIIDKLLYHFQTNKLDYNLRYIADNAKKLRKLDPALVTKMINELFYKFQNLYSIGQINDHKEMLNKFFEQLKIYGDIPPKIPQNEVLHFSKEDLEDKYLKLNDIYQVTMASYRNRGGINLHLIDEYVQIVNDIPNNILNENGAESLVNTLIGKINQKEQFTEIMNMISSWESKNFNERYTFIFNNLFLDILQNDKCDLETKDVFDIINNSYTERLLYEVFSKDKYNQLNKKPFIENGFREGETFEKFYKKVYNSNEINLDTLIQTINSKVPNNPNYYFTIFVLGDVKLLDLDLKDFLNKYINICWNNLHALQTITSSENVKNLIVNKLGNDMLRNILDKQSQMETQKKVQENLEDTARYAKLQAEHSKDANEKITKVIRSIEN